MYKYSYPRGVIGLEFPNATRQSLKTPFYPIHFMFLKTNVETPAFNSTFRRQSKRLFFYRGYFFMAYITYFSRD